MANYTTLRYGSSGDEVKKLQQKLGISDDGIYGSQTQKAVEDYQRQNGLQVDGIAGDETQGHMFGGSNPLSHADSVTDPLSKGSQEVQPTSAYTAPVYTQSEGVKQAQAILNQHLSQKPGDYQSQWQEQLDAKGKEILDRGAFSYDVNGDALYQQLADRYMQQGQMAMMDTMGQAAALTGGYGNTYAQRVGQQAYQEHLQGLNDMVPELQQMAMQRYQMEGDQLAQQYALLQDREQQDYSKWQEAQNAWLNERDYLAGRYDAERDYDYGRFTDERAFDYGKYVDERDFGYTQQENTYDKLANLISSTGYSPSAEELAAAGMSAGEAAAYAKYYADQNAPKGTGGGDPNNGKWASGIDTKRGTGEGQLKGSAWDYTKNNYSRLLYTSGPGAADKYMDQIVDELNEEQYAALLAVEEQYYEDLEKRRKSNGE